MNNVLIIGVGGTGSDAVDMLYKRIQTLKGEKNFRIKAVVFDTDDGDMAKIGEATTVSMSQNGTVGTVCDKLGVANVEEWFPFDDPAIRALPMNKGAGQWRKKSFLAFMAAMEQPERSLTFHRVMDSLFDSTDKDATYQIYTVASLAGGTGSGSFIPITLYAKRYMLETMHASSVQTAAVLACPGIYADQQTTEENRSKVYANAYAILRELNAMNLVANGYNNSDADIHHAPIKFKLGAEGTQVGVLFDSSDEKYWEATKATPFNNVFLFDKILGCESIKKHNEVLADSLFTVLCTSIGVAIDSEMDNHILLRALAQNTAIYASLGTSRLEYPKDTLLDYLAHKKALDAADGDWMTLYHKVEDY
ncbi:MAG: tubulin-like doman-containing protein, partial [Clostridia bacterium]|nr:tubulin-like doman-containing protein [Clostridia bacterium]